MQLFIILQFADWIE